MILLCTVHLVGKFQEASYQQNLWSLVFDYHTVSKHNHVLEHLCRGTHSNLLQTTGMLNMKKMRKGFGHCEFHQKVTGDLVLIARFYGPFRGISQ